MALWEKIRRDWDRRVQQKPRSMSLRIRAHCIECMGHESMEVRKCTSPACYLFPYRLSGVDHTDMTVHLNALAKRSEG